MVCWSCLAFSRKNRKGCTRCLALRPTVSPWPETVHRWPLSPLFLSLSLLSSLSLSFFLSYSLVARAEAPMRARTMQTRFLSSRGGSGDVYVCVCVEQRARNLTSLSLPSSWLRRRACYTYMCISISVHTHTPAFFGVVGRCMQSGAQRRRGGGREPAQKASSR